MRLLVQLLIYKLNNLHVPFLNRYGETGVFCYYSLHFDLDKRECIIVYKTNRKRMHGYKEYSNKMLSCNLRKTGAAKLVSFVSPYSIPKQATEGVYLFCLEVSWLHVPAMDVLAESWVSQSHARLFQIAHHTKIES